MKFESSSCPSFTFAFQPIVDAKARKVFSYEALVRGPCNEPAYKIIEKASKDGLGVFDQKARPQAISLAARLGIGCQLNLNFIPQTLYSSEESIRATLEAAKKAQLPIERIVLEITEREIIVDQGRFAELINEYRGLGLKVAIDDFGAGYSGLNLLSNFQPDQIKLDMALIRGIECHGARQAIVRAIGQVCVELGIDVIAEGVETVEEYSWLESAGLQLFQGYLFAMPAFEAFPQVHYPQVR
jgi:EAL domain-containing protein (putative c-di-GMP-specific phosphodiesterase class I)